MSNLYWLSKEQLELIKPYFPLSHGKPRVDDLAKQLTKINSIEFKGEKHAFSDANIKNKDMSLSTILRD